MRIARRRDQSKYPQFWDGLVGAWYPGTGPSSNTLYDLSGRDNHATLLNGPSWVDGNGTKALSFDGVNDVVNCGDVAPLNNLRQFTIAGWFRQNVLDVQGGMFGKITNANNMIRCRTWTDGNMYQYVYNAGVNGLTAFDYSTVIVANRWFHYSMVFNGNGSPNAERMKVYVDGQPIVLSFFSTFPTSVPDLAGAEFHIAENFNIATIGLNWAGLLNDIRVYNRNLPADEIKLLAQRPGIAYETNRIRRYSMPVASTATYRRNHSLMSGGF